MNVAMKWAALAATTVLAGALFLGRELFAVAASFCDFLGDAIVAAYNNEYGS